MYTYYTLSEEAQSRFEDLERELNRPIRLMPWSGLRTRGPFEVDDNFSREDCLERGITLYMGGGLNRRGNIGHVRILGSEFETYHPTEPPEMPIELDGEIIGEIVLPNQVFSYVNWQYYTEDTGYDELVNAYIEAIIACVDPELLTNWNEGAEERRRQALIRFVRSAYDRQLFEHREYIDECQRAISAAQSSQATNLRNMRQRQELLDAILLVRNNDSGERVLREWDLLQQHPRVTNCTFEANQLVITTTDDLRLYRDDTNESRWLGAFKININLSTLGIGMQNLNTRRGGRDHPHVTDGVPCFGGHSRDFAQLLGNGELLVVFELCLQYLERLNLADEYGRYGSYWFDVPDEHPLDAETTTEVTEAVAA